MDSGDFGALGFWIFVAAIVVAGSWSSSRREAEKHETLRRIVEKTGTIDEAKLKELFSTADDRESKPGGGYRALRVSGTILMFLGIVPAILGTGAGLLGGRAGVPPAPTEFVLGMLSISACMVVLGLGVFFSSRFAEPPPGSQNEPPAR
jgi:hypothetical protein